MTYPLVDTLTGEKAAYETLLQVSRQDGQLCFCFEARHSACYCPHNGYNENHYEGDVCEVFFGSKNHPDTYFEINLSPDNCLLFGRITYQGETRKGAPVAVLEKIDASHCFVKSQVQRTPGGYIARITLPEAALPMQPEDIRFNAFRIETDGGEPEKYLFALSPTYKPKFHVPGAFVDLYDYLSK